MNPHYTIPTMVDGDLIIVESRAALLHLARKYGQGRLLPNDENGLSLVEQRLFFDQGHMWPRVYGNLVQCKFYFYALYVMKLENALTL